MDYDAFTPKQVAFTKWMQINDLTFVRVADQSGVPYSTLKSFTKKPGQDMLPRNAQKIADGFKVPVADIFDEPKTLVDAQIQRKRAWTEHDEARNRAAVQKVWSIEEHEGDAPPEPEFFDIPEYDVRLSAGGGSLLDHEEIKGTWKFPAFYLNSELRMRASSLSMAEVRGDSMAPTLLDRDRVLVDHSDTRVAQGGIFAIWDGDGLVVKRIEVVPYSNPPQVVLISDNKNHNQYTVMAEQVDIKGRVVWYARRM